MKWALRTPIMETEGSVTDSEPRMKSCSVRPSFGRPLGVPEGVLVEKLARRFARFKRFNGFSQRCASILSYCLLSTHPQIASFRVCGNEKISLEAFLLIELKLVYAHIACASQTGYQGFCFERRSKMPTNWVRYAYSTLNKQGPHALVHNPERRCVVRRNRVRARPGS